MVRGNRNLIVASIFLALPVAFGIVSPAGATTPAETPGSPSPDKTVAQGEHAVVLAAGGSEVAEEIQQVGLFDVMAERRARSSAHQPVPQASTAGPTNRSGGGLLGEMFGFGNRTSASPPAEPAPSERSPAPSERSPAPADWSGVPFHEPNPVTLGQSNVPIRDPSAETAPRVVRGLPARTLQALPSSVRPENRLEVPQPMPEPRVIRSAGPQTSSAQVATTPATTRTVPASTPLSMNNSSRRSDRRTVAVLEPEGSSSADVVENANAARRTQPMESEELVPKVSRRELPPAQLTPAQPSVTPNKTIQPAHTVAANASAAPPVGTQLDEPQPSDSQPSDSQSQVATSQSSQTAPSTSRRQPEPSEATLARSGTETGSKSNPPSDRESPSARATASSAIPPRNAPAVTSGDVIMRVVPKSTLSPPVATTERSYTIPAEPTSSSEMTESARSDASVPLGAPSPAQVPLAVVPSQPYAASTPAAPIAHRTGPPAAEFEPRQMVVPHSTASSQQEHSSAIGSGLLPLLPNPVLPTPGSQVDHLHDSSAVPPSIAQVPRAATNPASGVPLHGSAGTFDPYRSTTRHPVRGPLTGTLPPSLAVPSPLRPHEAPAPVADGMRPAQPDAFAANTDATIDRATLNTRRIAEGNSAVASELPGIRVVTHGPREIMIRQTQQYEIRVENRGSIDAQGVMVRAIIPGWASVRGQNATRGSVAPQTADNPTAGHFSGGTGERLVWTIDYLPAGSSEQLFLQLRAERSGSHGIDVDWTLVPQKSVTSILVHEPQLALVIDGPSQVIYGQSQTYKVRVMNPGNGVAPNVVFTLSPNSATPQTQRIGDIPPGKEAQFEVELTAQDLGDLKIHGLASGDLELRAEAAKTIRVAAAKLEAVLSGPELEYQNTEAMYQLQIKNTGNATAEQVVATLQLPGGATYLGGISDSQQRGQVIKWKIDALPPDATQDFEFRCRMSATGEQTFVFDCQGTAAAQASVSLATRVESIADLVMTIDAPVAPAPVGKEVAYEITIRNRGTREATEVRAIAQFSHGVEPKRLEGRGGELLTGQALFDPIARIGAGEEVRLRVMAQADRAGHHRFRSEVRSGAIVLVAEEATHYMSPTSERVSRSSTGSVSR